MKLFDEFETRAIVEAFFLASTATTIVATELAIRATDRYRRAFMRGYRRSQFEHAVQETISAL